MSQISNPTSISPAPVTTTSPQYRGLILDLSSELLGNIARYLPKPVCPYHECKVQTTNGIVYRWQKHNCFALILTNKTLMHRILKNHDSTTNLANILIERAILKKVSFFPRLAIIKKISGVIISNYVTSLDQKRLEFVNKDISEIIQQFPYLQKINLVDCLLTNTTVKNLTLHFSKILSIDLNHSRPIKDTMIVDLATNCPYLQTLILQGCKHITDTALIALSKNCHDLKKLNIVLCKQLTDQGLSAIAQNSPHLHSLELSENNLITDAAFIALSQSCKKLQVLYALKLLAITDKGVRAIAQGCNNLQELSLDSCANVSNTGILAIAEHCHSLQSLNVSRCSKISGTHLVTVAAKLQKLVCMDIRRCSQVSTKTLEDIAKVCPGLKTILLSVVHAPQSLLTSLRQKGLQPLQCFD